MLYLLRKPEKLWMKEQIDGSLENDTLVGIHRGIAFTAANNWHIPKNQKECTSKLVSLASSEDEIVQAAVSEVFRYGENIPLNREMKSIIEAILPHDRVLLESAERLVEGVMSETSAEPELVGRICNRVLEVGTDAIQNIASRLASIAEPIVSIALTLHRKPPPHRAVGLEIFEKLIESNISAARHALDLLDRRPIKSDPPRPPRRRRRRKTR